MAKASETARQIAAEVEQLATALENVEVKIKEPKASTKATEKYQKEAGIAAKTYKLKEADAEIFKAACAKNGESQSAALTRLMLEYAFGKEEKAEGCVICRTLGKLKQKRAH